ncbi:MAG: glycosyltransferase family A protein [Desulfobacterales bacterium]
MIKSGVEMQSMNPNRAAVSDKTNDFAGRAADVSRPRVSFAIPVRNGERFLGRALESILVQNFDNFEIVVCDNASTDGTGDVVQRFGKRSHRVRYVRNEVDIGQIENFNRVYELSRGEFIRWMGADDWLDPDYARKCVAALDARPDAVGVTTQWRLVDDKGYVESLDVPGPRVDALTPLRRLQLVLRLLQGHRLLFDPIYSLLRRNALEHTGLLPVNRWTDRILAVELCLLGSFCHLDDCLSTRRNARESRDVRLPRFHERYKGGPREHRWMLYTAYANIVRRAPLTAWQKINCWGTIMVYWLRDEFRRRERRLKRILKK